MLTCQVQYDPTSGGIVSCSYDKTVRLWSVGSRGTEVWEIWEVWEVRTTEVWAVRTTEVWEVRTTATEVLSDSSTSYPPDHFLTPVFFLINPICHSHFNLSSVLLSLFTLHRLDA